MINYLFNFDYHR